MEIMYDIFTDETTNTTTTYQSIQGGGRFQLEVDGKMRGINTENEV